MRKRLRSPFEPFDFVLVQQQTYRLASFAFLLAPPAIALSFAKRNATTDDGKSRKEHNSNNDNNGVTQLHRRRRRRKQKNGRCSENAIKWKCARLAVAEREMGMNTVPQHWRSSLRSEFPRKRPENLCTLHTVFLAIRPAKKTSSPLHLLETEGETKGKKTRATGRAENFRNIFPCYLSFCWHNFFSSHTSHSAFTATQRHCNDRESLK